MIIAMPARGGRPACIQSFLLILINTSYFGQQAAVTKSYQISGQQAVTKVLLTKLRKIRLSGRCGPARLEKCR